jgi:hypothetical protein
MNEPMNEEQLKRQLNIIMKSFTNGCDDQIELKSKCKSCMHNAGPYQGKLVTCLKKIIYNE